MKKFEDEHFDYLLGDDLSAEETAKEEALLSEELEKLHNALSRKGDTGSPWDWEHLDSEESWATDEDPSHLWDDLGDVYLDRLEKYFLSFHGDDWFVNSARASALFTWLMGTRDVFSYESKASEKVWALLNAYESVILEKIRKYLKDRDVDLHKDKYSYDDLDRALDEDE
jgi:hypothetical protein